MRFLHQVGMRRTAAWETSGPLGDHPPAVCAARQNRVMSGSGEEKADEKLARRRLEPHLGPLEPTDVPGTSGLPDYRLNSPGVSGHVEVTSRPDKRRRMQRAAVIKRPSFTVAKAGEWTLYLHRKVDTRDLPKASELELVLDAAKRAGGLIMPGNCPLEVAERMRSLGIEGARYRHAEGSTGSVSLTGGGTGDRGVQGDDVDTWLKSAFQESGVLDHVQKLRRAGGDSRHLYLHVDSASKTGLAIAIALDSTSHPGAALYRLPTFVPPDDLTDLWVWPDSPGPGLHYSRARGWRIVEDVPWE